MPRLPARTRGPRGGSRAATRGRGSAAAARSNSQAASAAAASGSASTTSSGGQDSETSQEGQDRGEPRPRLSRSEAGDILNDLVSAIKDAHVEANSIATRNLEHLASMKEQQQQMLAQLTILASRSSQAGTSDLGNAVDNALAASTTGGGEEDEEYSDIELLLKTWASHYFLVSIILTAFNTPFKSLSNPL